MTTYTKLAFLSVLMISAFGGNAVHAAEPYNYVIYNNGYTAGLPTAGSSASTVNTTGASASIPPVSQRSAQYYRETVDATVNRTSANTAIGRTISGQVIMQSASGPVPIDAKTRYYTPDNAYLEQRRAIIHVQ